MQENGIRSILLRLFNQDSLENFFGAMRAHGYRNNNPTCDSFASSYRTLLLNNLMSAHSPGSNCEEDFGEGTLTTYQALIDMYAESQETDEEDVEVRVADGLPKMISCESKVLNNLGSQTKNYIAGYVIKKLNTVLFHDCSTCLSQVCSSTITKDHELTVARDYKPYNKYLLKYPNSVFSSLVQNSIDIIGHNLPAICHHKNVKAELTNIINTTLNINIIICKDHGTLFPKKYLNFIIKMIVHNWCTQINQIMKGKKKLAPTETDQIKLKAFNRYVTFSKRIRYT